MSSRFTTALAFFAAAMLGGGVVIAADHVLDSSTSVIVAEDGDQPDKGAPASTQDDAIAAALTAVERDYLYVPIAPCRLVDTRVAGGKIAAGQERAFVVKGTTGFAAQGGNSTGCGIPNAAVAGSFSFTTTESAGKGRLNAWPQGGTEPKSTVLSYTNANKVTSNPTVALRLSGSPHLRVANFDYATHLVVDVTGYYIGQIQAYVNSDGSLYAGSRIGGTTRTGVGAYTVALDTNAQTCSAQATTGVSGAIASAYTLATYVEVRLRSHDGTPTDGDFNLTVTC